MHQIGDKSSRPVIKVRRDAHGAGGPGGLGRWGEGLGSGAFAGVAVRLVPDQASPPERLGHGPAGLVRAPLAWAPATLARTAATLARTAATLAWAPAPLVLPPATLAWAPAFLAWAAAPPSASFAALRRARGLALGLARGRRVTP